MARTKKVILTPEEQLKKINDDIQAAEENIQELKKAKKELEEQIKMSRLTELDKIITASGKSYDEIMELLSK